MLPASRLCSKFNTPGSPCEHCGATIQAPRQHPAKCTVLWQISLMHLKLQADRNGAGAATGSLRLLGDGTAELHGVGANQKGSRAEQGKGRPWQPAPTNRPPWRKCGGKERHSDGLNLTYLIKALARLALQQETAINQGLLPLLFAAAQKWKKSQEEGATTTALRTTLFGCLIQMLHTGLKDIGGAAPTPFQTKAEEMKWLKDGSWCYQKWSPALGSLVIDEDRPPLNSAYQTSGSPATGTSHHPAALHDPPLSCHQTAGRQHDGGSFVL